MPNTFVNVSAPTVTQVKLQLSSPYIAADAAIQSIALNLAKDTVYYDDLDSYSSPTGNTLNNITTVPDYTMIIPAALRPTGKVEVNENYCEANGAKLIVNQSIFERDTYVLGFANVLNNVTQTPTTIYNLLKAANSLSGESGSLLVDQTRSNVVSTNYVTLEVESQNKSAITVGGFSATLDTTAGNFNNQEYELYKTVDKLTFRSSGTSFMNVHSYMTVDSTTNQYDLDINNRLNSTDLVLSDVSIAQQNNNVGTSVTQGFGLYKLSQVETTVYDSNVVGSGLFTNDACTTACNNTGKALSLNHLATHVPYDLTWKVEKFASGSGYTLPAGQAVNTLGSLTHTKGVANAPYMVSMANPNNTTHRLNVTNKGSLNKKTGATADLDYVTVGTEQEHLGFADYTKKTVFGVPNTLIANGRVGRNDLLTSKYDTYIFTQYDIDNRGSNYSSETQVTTGLTGENLTDNSVEYVVHSYSECSDRYKYMNTTSMMNSSLNSNSTGSKLVINSTNLPDSYTESFADKTVAGSAFSRLDLTLKPTTTYTYDGKDDSNNSVYANIDYLNDPFPLDVSSGVVGLTADVIGSGPQVHGNKLALRCTPKSTSDFGGSWSANWGWTPNQGPLASSGKQLTYSIIHTYCAQNKDITGKLVFPSKFVGTAKPAYLSVYPVITAFSSNYAEVSLQADLRNSANGKLATEVVGSLGRVIVGSDRIAMFESVDKQICFGPYTNIHITVPAFKITESNGVKNTSNGDVIYSYDITYNDNNSSNNWTAFNALAGTNKNGYTLTSQICGTYTYSEEFSEILCLKAKIVNLVSGVETPLSTGLHSVDPWYDFDESDTTIVIGTETFIVNINWNQNLTTVIAGSDLLYVDMTHPTSTISVSAANVIAVGETIPSAWTVDGTTCVYNSSVLSASIVQSENSNQSGYSSVITVQLGSDTIATLTYNNPAPSANIDLYWQPIPIFTVKRNGNNVITLNTSERVVSSKIMRIDDGVYVGLPVFSQIAAGHEISFSLWNDAIYELGLINNSASSYSRGSVTPRVLNIANNMTFSPANQKSVTFTNVRGNMGNTSPTNAYSGETTETSWIVLTRTVATGTFTIGSVTSTSFDIYNLLNLDIGYNSGLVQQSASSAANPIGLKLNFVSSSLLSDDAVTYSINVECDTYKTTITGNSIAANTTLPGIVAANGVVGIVGKVAGVNFSGSAPQLIYVNSICAAKIPRVVPDPTDTTANIFSGLDSTNYQQFINYMTNVSGYMSNIKSRDNSYNNGYYTQNYPIQQPDQNGKTVKDYYNIFYDIIVTNLPTDNQLDYLITNMAALTDAYNNFIKCVLYVFNVPTSLLDYWNKSSIPGMSRGEIESTYSQVNVDAWLRTNINTASNIPNVTDAAIQGNFWGQGVNNYLFNMTVYWAANYSLHYFGGRRSGRTITTYVDAPSSYDISFTVNPLVLQFQSKSTPIVNGNDLNCDTPKLVGSLAYSQLLAGTNVTIPNTNIKISRNTTGRDFYELPKAITSYYFQVQDSQYKFTTIAPGAYNALITRYVNITSVNPNGDGAARSYNPFSGVANANNTTFGVPASDHYYALATTAVSQITFPLQPLSLKMYQSSEEGDKYERYLYFGNLTYALLNIGADAPNGLKSISGGSTSNPGSALYTVQYYQDFSPDGQNSNYATERITFTFPENIPAGTAGAAIKYTVKASGAEDVYAYAMGAVIKRDAYGFPKAVEVEMYKSAEISKVSTLAQSSNNQNPIMTYTVGFSKKCVKTYSLGGLFNFPIDVHAVIAGLQESGSTFTDFTDLTTAEKAKYMLTFTPLNAGGLAAFGNMLHSAGSNIEYTLYTAISQPIRVTVDLAGNEISRLHENGSSTAKFLRLTR